MKEKEDAEFLQRIFRSSSRSCSRFELLVIFEAGAVKLGQTIQMIITMHSGYSLQANLP